MSKKQIITKLTQNKVKIFLKKYGILWLSLFGSYARDEARGNSDVDLLYIQDKNKELGLEFFDIIAFLENILKKKEDMEEQSYINKHIKKAILSDKIDII